MSWEEVIKQRDRKGKTERDGKISDRTGVGRFKSVKQTRIAGGNPAADMSPKDSATNEEDLFQYGEESTLSERERLAEMTRSDLMDIMMDRIGAMSTQEIIDILVRTQGDLGDAL